MKERLIYLIKVKDSTKILYGYKNTSSLGLRYCKKLSFLVEFTRGSIQIQCTGDGDCQQNIQGIFTGIKI